MRQESSTDTRNAMFEIEMSSSFPKYKFLEILKNIEIQISYKISINECSSNFKSALRAKHGAFLNNLGIVRLPFDRDTHPDHLGS